MIEEKYMEFVIFICRMLNRNLFHFTFFLNARFLHHFFCAYIIMNVVSNAIQLFYSIETKTVEQKIFHWSRKPGSHRDRNTTETNLSLPPPTPQSYQTSMATKSSLAFVKTFISRANERATSSRTATKPGSLQKRNEGNTLNSNQSRFTPITTVPLEAIYHAKPLVP